MGLSYKNFTDTEWDWVILIERMRGLNKKELQDFIGCGRKIIDKHWPRTLTYSSVIYSRVLSVNERVYRYMDIAYCAKEPCFTPEVLAELLDADPDYIGRLMAEWHEDVECYQHFPVECGFGMDGKGCGMRGSKINPILENGLCMECNAEEKGWPLDVWRENGQMVALLHQWGLMEDHEVAERYVRSPA